MCFLMYIGLFLLTFYITPVSGLELITTGADDLTYSDYWQYMTFNKFTPTTDGTLMNISVKVVDTTSGAAIKVAIYNDSSGVPYKPINSTIINTTIAGWFVVDLIVPMTAGSQYWIAYESQNNTVSARFQTTASGFSRQQTLNWYSAFPSPAASAVDTVTLYSRSYINEYPDVPVVTNPTNNSVNYDVTTLNMSWTTSTDTEGDEINYHYQIGNDSVFSDIAYEGNTSVNFSGSKTIPTTQLFFRVHANDSHGSSSWSPVVSIRDIILNIPANNSIQYFNYPPLITEFNFLWSVTNSLVVHYNLIIAKDSSFNLISSDTTFSGTSKTISLDSGTYWYKVRPYYTELGTYGSYTGAWTFSLIGNISVPAGTGIHGIVYELLGDVMTPVNGATVYISNTTWSSLQATGTNGYFLFSGLGTDTYTVYSMKSDYETSAISYVTPVVNATSTNNILMKRYISPYVPNFVYETIQIKNIFGTAYVGSTVTLYEGDGLTAYATGMTDSMGQVVFRVVKDQRYRITVSGGGISGTLTYYIYGKEEIYSITVVAGFPIGGDRYNDISTNLTVQDFNSTHKNMTLIYSDSTGSTSQIYFWATNLTTGTKCTQSSTADSVTLSCTVLASGYYEYGYNATSTKYGYFKESQIHNFGAGTPDSPQVATGIDKTLLQWASIIILVILASLFSITTVKYGAVVVPMTAMVLWIFGWFEPAPNNTVTSFVILSTAIILGVLVYMRMSEGKAVYT